MHSSLFSIQTVSKPKALQRSWGSFFFFFFNWGRRKINET